MKIQFTLSFAIFAYLAVGLQATEECACQFFLEGGNEKNNFVYGEDHKMDELCHVDGEQRCVDYCLEKYKLLTKDGDLTQPALPYFETYGHAACLNIARDVYRKKVELYAKTCDGKVVPTGYASKQELCCRDNQPYQCPGEEHEGFSDDAWH